MRITEDQRRRTEARIRAAMDRLLRGDLPSGGKCDIKTLAAEAGITRNGLYTTYTHLRDEFETRRDRLHEAGVIVDPREGQISRLKAEITALRARAAERDTEIADLAEFRTLAISRLAAQHEEIVRLRKHVGRHGSLHPTSNDSQPR